MGLLRFFLALSVIAGHSETTVFGFRGIGAWYAVNLFFIISGFYMAMVLNEKYKDISPILFYRSRALRLFPAYYVGLLLAIFISFEQIYGFFTNLSLVGKLYYIFENVFIFGQDLSYLICVKTLSLGCAYPVRMTINPPAWSLAVELGFYLVAPYIIKSEKKTFYFILLGCLYLISVNGISFPLANIDYLGSVGLAAFNYYFYPSSFVFFGGGALAYHLSKRRLEPHYFAAITAIVLLSFTQTVMPFWHLLFISMSIPVLFNYTSKNTLDRSIGELSYPAYILHFPLLILLRPYVQSHPQYFEFVSLGSWVAIASCVIGYVTYVTIEKRINGYRDEITFRQSGVRAFSDFPAILVVFYLLMPVGIVSYVYSGQMYFVQNHESTPFNLTDENWINGIGVKISAFFVSDSEANFDYYQVGRRVSFSSGEIREIVRVERGGMYLNVFLSGNPLDGKKIGFPNIVEIVK